MSPALLSCSREGRLAMPRFFATEGEDARAVERKGKEEENWLVPPRSLYCALTENHSQASLEPNIFTLVEVVGFPENLWSNYHIFVFETLMRILIFPVCRTSEVRHKSRCNLLAIFIFVTPCVRVLYGWLFATLESAQLTRVRHRPAVNSSSCQKNSELCECSHGATLSGKPLAYCTSPVPCYVPPVWVLLFGRDKCGSFDPWFCHSVRRTVRQNGPSDTSSYRHFKRDWCG